MKRSIRLGLVTLVLATMCVLPAGSTEPEAQLAALGWLEGEWLGEFSGGTWEARYTGPAGGLILSTNKSVREGRLRSWEYEQFRVENGAVIMQPYPDGEKSPVLFTLMRLDEAERKAVFENLAHDFPQILTYQRKDDATLHIQVQARQEGELVGFELTLKRAP
jgi:hypothetical protein